MPVHLGRYPASAEDILYGRVGQRRNIHTPSHVFLGGDFFDVGYIVKKNKKISGFRL